MANANCTNCKNCTSCKNCTNCVNCYGCFNCTNCTDCTNCMNCTCLTGYEGLWINLKRDAHNPRFAEAIAVLSTVAPRVWVANVGYRYESEDGNMWVHVPKEKASQ